VATDGIEAAVERAHAYVDAGADMLFIEALRDDEQLNRVGSELGPRAKLLCNMVEGGKTPLKPVDELGELGFDLVIYPGAMVRVVSFAAQAYLRELQQQGTTAGMLDRMNQFNGIMDVVGLQQSIAEGQAYASDIKDARK
jgi:2-methylisocitrate lyase-like PEP mutase family enzyme